MTTPAHRARFAACAVALVLAGCGGAPTPSAAPETTVAAGPSTADAAAVATFCEAFVDVESASASGPPVDFATATPEEIQAALQEFGTMLEPFIAAVEESDGRCCATSTHRPRRPHPPTPDRPSSTAGCSTTTDLVSTVDPQVPAVGTPDRTFAMTLRGTDIDVPGDTLDVDPGEWVRFTLRDESAKWHPAGPGRTRTPPPYRPGAAS